MGQFYTSNGISNETAYVYLATGVELGEAHREPTELMVIQLVPVAEALRMAREAEISDGPSALALLWCEPFVEPGARALPGFDAARSDVDPGQTALPSSTNTWLRKISFW